MVIGGIPGRRPKPQTPKMDAHESWLGTYPEGDENEEIRNVVERAQHKATRAPSEAIREDFEEKFEPKEDQGCQLNRCWVYRV